MLNKKDPPDNRAATTGTRKGINHHFKREGRWVIWLVVGVPAILLIAVFVLGPALLTLIGG